MAQDAQHTTGGRPFLHQQLAQQRVHHGARVAEALADEIDRAGLRRVVLFSTRSLAASDLVARCESVLGERLAGRFDAIGAHSPRPDVLAAAAFARARGADGLLAVGGGSVIDAAKVVLQCLWYDIDTLAGLDAIAAGRHAGGADASDWNRDPQPVRMIAVPTTLSAAEFNHVAGITDPVSARKQRFVHPLAAPVAVILDPAATLGTPARLLLSTGIRAVDHAVERWCSRHPTPYSDALSLQAFEVLAKALPAIHADPADLDARGRAQTGMWLAMLPSSAVVPMGASHGIGYILGAVFHVPHGITSCLSLPAVLEWNAPVNGERQRALARVLAGAMGDASGDDTAADAPVRLRQLIAGLGLPTRLRDAGLSRSDLDTVAAGYDGTGPIATNPRPVTGAADLREILELAW